jgi:hypothetical protein
MEKEIEGHVFYTVTDTGEVYSYCSGEALELKWDISNGYPRVNIGGKRKYVADLVAEAFLPPPKDPRHKIFYIDGNKLNCDVRNLVWLSQSDIQFCSQYTLEYRKQYIRERA